MDTSQLEKLLGMTRICPTPSEWNELRRELGPVLEGYQAATRENARLGQQLQNLLEAAIAFGSYAQEARTHNTGEYMEEYWERFREFERVIVGCTRESAGEFTNPSKALLRELESLDSDVIRFNPYVSEED